MKRVTFAALILTVACKSEPSSTAPAVTSEAPSAAAPANPHAAPGAVNPHAAPGAVNPHAAGGAVPPAAHGTNPSAAQTAPRPLEKLADGRVALGPFSMTVPAGWAENPSTSSMRAAQFTLPAAAGGDAEVVVYHFGETGAGSVQANIDRWLGQFKQPDGKPSSEVAKIEKAQFAGQDASVVSVAGRYVAPATPGGEPQDKPDQALVAAIVPSPKGPYYFRLIGSKAAVAAQESAFRQALSSLKLQ
jgi:hypothetical protein